MGHVRDRWMIPDPDTNKKVRGPRYGRGKRWLARWVEPDGRERSAAFTTRDAAQAHLDRVEVDKRTGSYVRESRTTFEGFARQWLARQVHHREGTAAVARIRLERGPIAAFGDRRIGAVTRAMVQDMIVEQAATYAPSTVRVTGAYTAAVFQAAVDDRLISRSPWERIRLPELVPVRVRPPSVSDVQVMVGRCIDGRAHEGVGGSARRLGGLRAFVLLLAGTGLRPGEARSLTWDRVTRAGVVVDRQLTGGGVWGPLKTPSSYRTVPLAPSTRDALVLHRERYGAGGADGLLFHREGAPWTRSTLKDAWHTVAEGLQVGAGWHQLRHHHASLLIASGLSPRAVADRLGHADPAETLATYSHLWPSDQERILSVVEAAYGPGTDQR